jgi:hypothetical protein
MKIMKQGPIGQLRRRKCKLRNNKYSREEVRNRNNHRQFKNKNIWRPL